MLLSNVYPCLYDHTKLTHKMCTHTSIEHSEKKKNWNNHIIVFILHTVYRVLKFRGLVIFAGVASSASLVNRSENDLWDTLVGSEIGENHLGQTA